MHPMFRVLALSLALAVPIAKAQAAEKDAPVKNTLAISTTSAQVATTGAANTLTLSNDSNVMATVLCHDAAGKMVTPTAKGCPGLDAQPMALDDPDLNPAYFSGSAVAEPLPRLLVDLMKYKGNAITLYLSNGRSLNGTLTDVERDQVGFRDSAGTRYHVDPGRIVAFGEPGE